MRVAHCGVTSERSLSMPTSSAVCSRVSGSSRRAATAPGAWDRPPDGSADSSADRAVAGSVNGSVYGPVYGSAAGGAPTVSSGRDRHTTSTSASESPSAASRIISTRVGPAQWKSSSTSTTGARRPSASSRQRNAHPISSMLTGRPFSARTPSATPRAVTARAALGWNSRAATASSHPPGSDQTASASGRWATPAP